MGYAILDSQTCSKVCSFHSTYNELHNRIIHMTPHPSSSPQYYKREADMYFVSIKKKAIHANFVGKSDIPNDKQH